MILVADGKLVVKTQSGEACGRGISRRQLWQVPEAEASCHS